MKAILVIDMPEVCGVCPLCQPDNERNMCYCGKTMADIKLAEKPDWCPIKPMPTKKKPLFDPNHCEIEEEIKIIHEIIGYNRCVDEIMGETE